jgi:hypothetical protein
MKTEDLDRLRAALRRGDPAADGGEPDAGETQLLRERLLESAAEARPDRSRTIPWRLPVLRPAFAAAVALVLTLALAVVLRLDRVQGPQRPAGEAAGSTLDAEAGPAPRQVQFTTPGGTRIVWVLYPEPPVYP